MKELDQHKKRGDKTVIVKQTQKEYQLLLEGTIVPYPGQKVFSINKETNEIKEADYFQEAINFTDAAKGVISAKCKLVTEENCIYIPALNPENALKKFLKSQNQRDYYKKTPIAKLGDHFI